MASGKNAKEHVRTPLRAPESKKAVARRKLVRLGLLVLLLVQGVAVAMLTNPASLGSDLPLSADFVGKVATSDIRAPISFTVPDTEATERKRQEAAAAVRSVYDFESKMGRDLVGRLREAFGRMQAVVQQYQQERDGQEGVDGGRSARRLPQREEELVRQAESLDARLQVRKSDFQRLLQVVVKDADFQQLVAERFSRRVLEALVLLIERTMRHMIVQSRELMEAERAQGVTIRLLETGVPVKEMVVRSFNRILDVEEARLRIEQAAALELSDMPRNLRRVVVHMAESLIGPNMVFNREETEKRRRQARESVQPLEIRIQKGAKILRDGDLIRAWHVRVLQHMQKLTELHNVGEKTLGTLVLVVALLGALLWFALRSLAGFHAGERDLFFLGSVMLVFLVTIKIWHWVFGAVWERFQVFPLESLTFAIPFAAGAMLIRFVLNMETALVFTIAASALAGLVMDHNLGIAIFCLASSLVAAWSVASARQRSSLFRAGAITGLANVAFALALDMFDGNFLQFKTLFDVVFAFSGGILVAMIVMSSTPVVEMIFGYTTDIKLMELANLNHPLLKDLIVQAPGSYHHSIIVGSLVEAAAEVINCNPLLARVMAYYHDIGKVKNPHYFSENQRDGSNPHDKLKPSLSATILKAHVKDGAELARQKKLGQPIIDAILQHHGTSLIKFFYQKAKEQEDPENPVKEEEFRYPGPRPQSREVALVMLADSVEAAAKSISDPSPARLQGLVQTMINRIFADGQLDESDLTLKDLHEIARSFNRVLAGIYHRRPDYPQAAVKERESGERRKSEGRKNGAEKPSEDEQPGEDLKRLGM